MKINKVVFTWKKLEKDLVDYNNMNRMDVIFCRGEEKPTIVIEAGNIKIEDKTFEIDSKEILEKIGKVNFDKMNDLYVQGEYSGENWELIVNDKKYEGIFEEPFYVTEIKKIIRFSAIQLYANKKLGKYLRS